MRPRRDRGFAMVAAVAAVGAFAYISFEVLAADRGVVAGVSGRIEQARLVSAADAGMMMAIHGVGQEDASQRWAIDGKPREVEFRGIDLIVTVQDERGKAPLDGLNPAQSRAMFAGSGASGDQLDALVNELRDFQSGDDEETVTAAPVNAQGLAAAPVRRGGFRVVGDLMSLKDMTPDIYFHLSSAVTVFFEESGPFEPTHANPLAVATMAATEDESPEESQLEQSVDNERPEESIVDENLIGRTLTINVVARARGGLQTHRMAIVELTGSKTSPYWFRYSE